jgi:hypothetical protein
MTAANSTSILKRENWRDARWALALRNWGGYAAAVIVRLKALAPYALIEIVLPGGSVMALLLWLYRRRKSGVGFGPISGEIVVVPPVGRSFAFQRGCVCRSECGRLDDRIEPLDF